MPLRAARCGPVIHLGCRLRKDPVPIIEKRMDVEHYTSQTRRYVKRTDVAKKINGDTLVGTPLDQQFAFGWRPSRLDVSSQPR